MQYPFGGDSYQDGEMEPKNNESATFAELNNARLSGSFTHRKRLWLDEYGVAKIWYTVGKTTHLNTEAALRAVVGTVLQAVKLWTSKTDGCIQFVKLLPDACSNGESLDHGAVHIDTFEARCCSANLGNLYSHEVGAKKCQEMCIDIHGCTDTEIKKLVSNTLGLLSPMNRPDRDDYIAFHPELLSERLWPPLSSSAKPRWLSLQRCWSSFVSIDLPVPYDFLSTLHPVTSQYSESQGDPQGVIVTQDGMNQYLLDYRPAACPELSHLDLFQVHKAYGCEKKFAQNCQGTPPKCLNYGYLKKDCTCACAKNFGGARCEKKLDEGFHFCSGNDWFLNVSAIGLYNTNDLDMYLSQEKVPRNGNHLMKFMQFLTVSVHLAELGKHVSVSLNQTAMHTVITKLQSKLGYFIDNINITECDLYSGGSVLYWGASLSKHIRTWCFSSLFLNEPSPTILRSRIPGTIDLVFRSSIGIITKDAQLSIDALQLQLEVSSFGVFNVSQHGAGENAGNGARSTGGGAKKGVAEALVEAGVGGLVGALLMGVLLLAVIGGMAAWMWSQKDDEESEYSDDSSDGTGDFPAAKEIKEAGLEPEDGAATSAEPASEGTEEMTEKKAETGEAGEVVDTAEMSRDGSGRLGIVVPVYDERTGQSDEGIITGDKY